MRYILEKAGSVRDTVTGTRSWFPSISEAFWFAYVSNLKVLYGKDFH